ncbi:MAG: conjugal transfer protein TraD [Alphaproteobacteria bacterium]|nr:conjugal transfer protein TraD [Alphaproteobacteria bacterium]
MDSLSLEHRRTRTRFLIQLGGLIEKAGLLKTFGITLGEDLQKAPDMKEPVAALFKGLLVLNELANSEDVDLQLWAEQGLQEIN